MEIALLIGITGALGCFALGLGVFILGTPPSGRGRRGGGLWATVGGSF